MAWSDAARAAALEMRRRRKAGQPWRITRHLKAIAAITKAFNKKGASKSAKAALIDSAGRERILAARAGATSSLIQAANKMERFVIK